MRTYFSQRKLLSGALVCLTLTASGCSSMGGGTGGSWPGSNWFSWGKKSPDASIASRPAAPSSNLPSPTATANSGRPAAAGAGQLAQPGAYPYSANNQQMAQGTGSGYPTGHYNTNSPAPYGANAGASGQYAAQNQYARPAQAQTTLSSAPANNGAPQYQSPYGQQANGAVQSSWNGAAPSSPTYTADARAASYDARQYPQAGAAAGGAYPNTGANAWSFENRGAPAAAAGGYAPTQPNANAYTNGYNAQPTGTAGGAAAGSTNPAPTGTPGTYRPGSTSRNTGTLGGVQPASYGGSWPTDKSTYQPAGTAPAGTYR